MGGKEREKEQGREGKKPCAQEKGGALKTSLKLQLH